MPKEPRTDTDTDPRIGEEQLEALQALAEFEDVELRALRDLAQDRASEYVNRRSLIKSAGALTGMGIAGSVGYNEGVQQAKADASTSDSDGDVGTPSNPVDVFADGVDAVSTDTDAEGVGEVAHDKSLTNQSPSQALWNVKNDGSASKDLMRWFRGDGGGAEDGLVGMINNGGHIYSNRSLFIDGQDQNFTRAQVHGDSFMIAAAHDIGTDGATVVLETDSELETAVGPCILQKQTDGTEVFQTRADGTAQTEGSKEVAGIPASSTDPGLTFGTWRQPSASRPVQVVIDVKSQTDGTNDAYMDFQVDESGGTTADYTLRLATADAGLGSGNNATEIHTQILPAGAQYKVVNSSDPNTGNEIRDVREFVL